MARKHRHEDHVNHEAWAIPYGDLMTLLLAFFVVMYAISSINEGKFRAMSDALNAAFGGNPRTIAPIQLGRTQLRGSAFDRPSPLTAGANSAPTSFAPVKAVRLRQVLELPTFGRNGQARRKQEAQEAHARRERQLNALGRQIRAALGELVRQKLVSVRRGSTFLEVEIQSDILFASGVATPSPMALATVRKLGAVLRRQPNAVRVEGYTDDRPIRTAQFPSNWELSAARAASVVHVLIGEGVSAARLAVVGYGEHQPIADNATVEGRNANRRVLLVILAEPQAPDAVPDTGPTVAFEPDAQDAPVTTATDRAADIATANTAAPAPAANNTPLAHAQDSAPAKSGNGQRETQAPQPSAAARPRSLLATAPAQQTAQPAPRAPAVAAAQARMPPGAG